MRDRAYALTRAVVIAALVVLAIASGFTAGGSLSNQRSVVHAWGP
ncbi:MAG TPA: hypothetical protein VKA84_17690 [Gemmatimonadaceae bacterium]|nr:hypothetical protein [Gemmatimonadaceae bacterium]